MPRTCERATPLLPVLGCVSREFFKDSENDEDEGAGEGELLAEEPLPEVKEKDMLSWAEWRGCIIGASSRMSSKTISATFSSDGADSSSKAYVGETRFYKKFIGKGVRLRKFLRRKGGCAERLVRYEKKTRRLCWNTRKWWSKRSGYIFFDGVLDVEQYETIVQIKTLRLGELAFECRNEEEASLFFSVLHHFLDERPSSDGPTVGGPMSPSAADVASDVDMMTSSPRGINSGGGGGALNVDALGGGHEGRKHCGNTHAKDMLVLGLVPQIPYPCSRKHPHVDAVMAMEAY